MILPTHVGVNPFARIVGSSPYDPPHTRGGEPNPRLKVSPLAISSPHTWG